MELYYHLYLRRGVLFLPTTGRVEKGHYRNAEPVAVVPISNTEGAREALRATVARGNPPTPHYQPGNYPPSPILKYAGVKSWSIFARDAKTWSIHEENEIYQIVGYRKHAKGYWVEDSDQKIDFPPGTTVDAVIERMIAILEEAASLG
ncbi:MAG: hypothetical protein WCA56_05410 [Xanthobacteraceae bacterium]|jgi:hypothetical protein